MAASDTDALRRRSAGEYATADERFTVRQGDVGWFVVDTAQTNEFGQELIHGPYATLKAAREAIPGAREAKPTAPPRPIKAPRSSKEKPARKRASKPKPEPEPRSWVDELRPPEARRVRALVSALERQGVEHAEELVRRDRDGLLPAIAETLIASRLAALVDEQPAARRADARKLVQRAADIITGEGLPARDPLPGWVLVEVEAEGDAPSARRIDLRR